MKSKYYHATDYNNLNSILENGLKPGWDGIVYLCKTPFDAAKFCVIRGMTHILVVEAELDDAEIQESFDHSEKFFQCKAYGITRIIQSDEFTGFTHYQQNKEGKWI